MMDHLLMRRPHLNGLPALLDLPPGYTLRTYREGDLEAMATVMQLAFEDPQWTGLRLRRILVDAEDVKKIFIVDYLGAPVASASARLLPDRFPDSGYVHWVGVHPQHRGHRLGYMVTLATLYEFVRQRRRDAVLETDDHRIPAIKTYYRLGFAPEIINMGHQQRWEQVSTLLARTLSRTDAGR